MVCPGDPPAQTVYILDKIAASIARPRRQRSRTWCAPGSTSATPTQWEAVARAHGRYFGDIRPANTLVEVSRLVGDYEVEIEAEAVVAERPSG